MEIHLIRKSWAGDIFSTRFQPGCLEKLPWGAEPFECFLLSLWESLRPEEAEAIAREVARANTEWVHTAGPFAETLHDLVDEMSVMIGRQHAVGDGSPMTAWHSDLTSVDQMTKFATSIRFGGTEYLLVLVVGDSTAYQEVVDALRQQVAVDSHEDT